VRLLTGSVQWFTLRHTVKCSDLKERPVLDPGESLYHRLGGFDAIAAAVDDLLPRLVSDPQIGVFWKGKCDDSMRKDRQLIVEFLCEATGGPANYVGRDMKTSHEGLGITEGDWAVFVEHTVAMLSDLGVPDQEKDEFLAAAGSLKGDIVGAPRLAAASR
jgi:hemoglobin